MEVIQWISLWNMFKDEFDNEKNMLGGSLGDKAAEDLRQRIIEHVILCTFSSMRVFLSLFDLLSHNIFANLCCRTFLLSQNTTCGLH